jgi:hypothetical protein
MSDEQPTDQLPDFSQWTTRRLSFILEDYKSSLSSCRTLMGRGHPESLIYEKWVNALQEELDKRL